ncbi:ABC transporter permease [Algibacter pectinivorans]|uniref:Putative ABC transport system permease protein n=1 Tax=Algibacter pectinivorans TaxID=870482 RepID=A0A1I1RYT5_9FLAO|nr:FtsX-like permease family protein [Algibacter pectinivorans]SFD39425.1 putative ABC transport system permease protein [Algibacter pectinivorans]
MNIWKISLQNLKSKPLYTLLSILTLTLSFTLLLGVQQLKTSFKYQMDNNLGEIDLVVGAKGSPLQLVLASVLHLDSPTGNIRYEDALKLAKNPLIKSAVPISYGDNYKGFRIVGTTKAFLALYNSELQEGRHIKNTMEVVLGNSIAKRLDLNIGDTFLSSHGFMEHAIETHNETFTIVGILKPTQKVIDRLIVTNLESVWNVHTHEVELENELHHHEESIDKEHDHDQKGYNSKEITSLLLTSRKPSALLTLPRKINTQTNMQAILPKFELEKLNQYTGVGFNTLSWIAYFILVVSGITIFISLYKMITERSFDLALLRTYGASNVQLIKIVAYEGLIITLFAVILGITLTNLGLYYLLGTLEQNYQYAVLNHLAYKDILLTLKLVLIAVLLSILLAVYPILKMNISTILSHEK